MLVLRRWSYLSIVLSVFLCVSLVCSVKAASTMWLQTYGGINVEDCNSIVKTSDGGYALAGYTTSFGAGAADFWLVKTDANGNELWNKTYGGTEDDIAWSMIQTSDEGYALAGYTYSYSVNIEKFDFWLVKTDSSGNAQWNKTYGGSDYDWAWSVVQTPDGGYALAGHTASFGAGDYDFWLVKTDSDGNELWNKTYGGTSWDDAYSMVQTSDGGFAIAGRHGSYSFWLVKTNSTGDLQWDKKYVKTGYSSRAHCVVETIDGGFALAGMIAETGETQVYDFWLVKTDANGNELWNKTYGGTEDDIAWSMIQTSDEGYCLVGSTGSLSIESSALFVKTDALGNLEWNQTYEEMGVYSLVQTADGGYVFGGPTVAFGSSDAFLMKTDEYGVVPETSWIVLPLLITATVAIFLSKKKLLNKRL